MDIRKPAHPPRIGIRPIIDSRCRTADGRRHGVREALEEKTMTMARAAADLISRSVCYPWGEPVECIISDTTIGGAEESAACAAQFSTENVVATLSVTPSWCYGTETIDMDPNTVKAIWGYNGTERPGAVYLACAMAAHAQRGLPCFSIYGRDVQDLDDSSIPGDVAEKILRFAKAAVAVGVMRGKSYLNIGGVSMGIAGSNVDPMLLQRYFGMHTQWVDMNEVARRVESGIYDPEEYKRAYAWTKLHCPEGRDVNHDNIRIPREQKDANWEYCIKMALVIRDLMIGNPKLYKQGHYEEAMGRNAIACGFQGQRQWTDWRPNADFAEAILNSSFDWNGVREPFVVATENDVLNGMSMLVGHLLTGAASVFADVRTYWSPEAIKRVSGWTPHGRAKNGFIHLINSGSAALDGTGVMKNEQDEPAMKPWWQVTGDETTDVLSRVDWCEANLEYFRGGGYSSHFRTDAEMPVTLIRINNIANLGPVMQIAEGYTVTVPDHVFEAIDSRTDPTWPTTFFVPNLTGEGAFADVYSVMANWGANHGAFSYGHIGDQLITLCSMLRIPVALHNVPESRIFRPHSFSAFGTKDLEAADYRACAAYGPLYR